MPKRKRVALFSQWQAEAQECQRMLDELDDRAELDAESFAYWRGRRDALESCALELLDESDPFVVSVISDGAPPL